MRKNFNIFSNFNLIVGNGEFRKIPKTIKLSGFEKPLFIVDKGFSHSKLWNDIKKKLLKSFKKVDIVIFPNKSEPTYSILNKFLKVVKKKKF